MNHNVFRDLAPSYIDNLTSEETNKLMEKHLMECKDCKDFLNEMREDLSLEIEDERRKDTKNIDYLKKVRSKNRKKTMIIVSSLLSVFIIILISLFIYLDWSLTPLPEEKRNISSSDIKMIVDFQDVANRTPIVRTYTKEEFINFDKKEIEDIKDTINGNIEGDIPALVLENGRGEFEISFVSSDNSTLDSFKPDNIPQIKILVSTFSAQRSPKEVEGFLIEDKENKAIYSYELKRYFTKFTEEESTMYESDEFFMEFMYIEVNYEIDKQEYVSVFAIHTVEYK